MMHRLCSQLSLNRSLSFAVSTLALITGFFVLGMVKPQIMGNTVSFPALEVAITGTMSVGLISPSVFNGRDNVIDIGLVRVDFRAFST